LNFNQWRNYISKGTVPKIVYCCGDQTALVELVVEDIKNTLQVPVTDFHELDARTDQSVWEHASTYPLDPKSTRLTIVRHAEYVNNWHQLVEWLTHTKKNTKNYILFISYQSDAPYVYTKGKKDGYVEHIEIIRNKGKLIRCSQPNDDDLISWAKSYGLTQAAASHLVERTSGDTSAMLSVLKKVHVWSGSPSNNALDLLCEEKALDSFADYLILRDKTNAYLALQSMTDEQKSKIISHLDYRLDTVMEIARCLRKRMYATDIAASTGIKIFLVKRFIPVAKEYDDKKIRQCRQLLAMIDSAQNQGAKVGTWETIISLW
jgi:DNA polymerase III delta subunit